MTIGTKYLRLKYEDMTNDFGTDSSHTYCLLNTLL